MRGLRIVMAARNKNLRHMLYNDRNDDGTLRSTYERPQAGKRGHGSEGWELRERGKRGGAGGGKGVRDLESAEGKRAGRRGWRLPTSLSQDP